MSEIKRLSRTLVKHGSILDFYQDEMQVKNGKVEIWDMIEHRLGAAAVVPVLPSGDILLVRQFRPAIDRYTWELPAGSRDAVDEDMEVCAKRELKEETGFISNEWSRLLSLRTTVAFCNERVDVFMAKNIQKVSSQQLDDAEEIELKAFTKSELIDMIYSGTLQDGKTVSGLLAAIRLIKD